MKKLILSLALCGLPGFAHAQGDLDPPLGAPAPNMKSLQQLWDKLESIETSLPSSDDPRTPITSLPFTINAPGSYYLTGNLTFDQPTGSAIRVLSGAEGATLDLNGFTLASTQQVTGAAISATASISVRNGTIAGTTSVENSAAAPIPSSVNYGGFSNGVFATKEDILLAIHDIYVTGCREDGLWVRSEAIVSNCRASENGKSGFRGQGSNFDSCTSLGNAEHGFSVIGCVVEKCQTTQNGEDGFHAPAGIVSRCRTQNNGGHGFYLGNGSGVISFCYAVANGGDNISAGVSIIRNSNSPAP